MKVMEVRMLREKLTGKGNWEISKNTVTTKGGCFVGYASSENDVKMFAAGPKLLELIKKYHKDDKSVLAEVKSIFEAL